MAVYFMKRLDLFIITGALLAAGIVFLILQLTAEDGAVVEVVEDGEVIAEFSLDEDITYEIVTDSGTNTLVIEGGAASVTDADCADKICVNHAAISKDGESIICLPHKIMVRISGGEETDLDAISG